MLETVSKTAVCNADSCRNSELLVLSPRAPDDCTSMNMRMFAMRACTHTRTFVVVGFMETPALGDSYGGTQLYPPRVAFVCISLLGLFQLPYSCTNMFLARIIFMLHSISIERVQFLCCTVFESSINTLKHHRYVD
jgi:hypothetical protein